MTVLNGYSQDYAEHVKENVNQRACPFGEILCAVVLIEDCADHKEDTEEQSVTHHRRKHNAHVEHLYRKRPDTEVDQPSRPVDKRYEIQTEYHDCRKQEGFDKSFKARLYFNGFSIYGPAFSLYLAR